MASSLGHVTFPLEGPTGENSVIPWSSSRGALNYEKVNRVKSSFHPVHSLDWAYRYNPDKKGYHEVSLFH